MAWAIVVSTVLVLLVLSRGFRIVALGLVALLLAAVAIHYYLDDLRPRSLIPVSELVLEDVVLGGSYKLSGRVKNNSKKYALERVTLVVTMRDCNTVGDGSELESLFDPRQIEALRRAAAADEAGTPGAADDARRLVKLITQTPIPYTANMKLADCVTIGESKNHIYTDVPPGQTRDFQESVHFDGTLVPKHWLIWHSVVSETSGK